MVAGLRWLGPDPPEPSPNARPTDGVTRSSSRGAASPPSKHRTSEHLAPGIAKIRRAAPATP